MKMVWVCRMVIGVGCHGRGHGRDTLSPSPPPSLSYGTGVIHHLGNGDVNGRGMPHRWVWACGSAWEWPRTDQYIGTWACELAWDGYRGLDRRVSVSPSLSPSPPSLSPSPPLPPSLSPSPQSPPSLSPSPYHYHPKHDPNPDLILGRSVGPLPNPTTLSKPNKR